MDTDLRQPLKRRSLLSRLVAARPTALRLATVCCVAALGAIGTWAVVNHEPYGGQPVVHMQLDMSDPITTSSTGTAKQQPGAGASQQQSAVQDAGDDDPDLGADTPVIDLSDATPTGGNNSGTSDLERIRQELAAKTRDRNKPQKHVESPPGAISVSDLPKSRQQAALTPQKSLSLTPAPVRAITGKGPHGALPVISKDGKRAAKVYARPLPHQQLVSDLPKIALLISGMGLNDKLTREAIAKLPPEVSLAFAPYGAKLQPLANEARARGHELFLQLPMEPFGYPSIDPGPRTLLTALPAAQNIDHLHWHLARFSGYAGVTNYLGAQFAANSKAIGPVLQELGKRGLVYVDDGSKGLSKATGLAHRFGLPARSTSVSLDGSSVAEVTSALARLEAMARKNGFAIGTGAGLPHTIEAVSQWSRALGGKRILLVPVSASFATRRG